MRGRVPDISGIMRPVDRSVWPRNRTKHPLRRAPTRRPPGWWRRPDGGAPRRRRQRPVSDTPGQCLPPQPIRPPGNRPGLVPAPGLDYTCRQHGL